MSTPQAPGPLIGRGRSADVFDLGNGRVLRRYRYPIDVRFEALIMRHLHQAGYPVPVVYDADGADLVMERLDGTDMLAAIVQRPWTVRRHARMLADLHNRLHEITAPPDWKPGRGDKVLHLDLHPANVMLTSRGPVVIDWVNAQSGTPGVDVAMAYLIMTTSDLDLIPLWLRTAAMWLRHVLVREFLRNVRDEPWPHIAKAAEARIADRNTRSSEVPRLHRAVQRAAQRANDREADGPVPGSESENGTGRVHPERDAG
jgi:aminoglycoside phosphotransferase (APT) family kinase protein